MQTGRFGLFCVLAAASLGGIWRASAQIPVWRTNMMGMLSLPPGNLSYRDIERFEGYMRSATCTGLTAADYAANQALVSQWTGYFGQVNAVVRDAQTRAAVIRAWRSVALFPCAYAAGVPRPPSAPPAPPQPNPPPFAMQPPAVQGVSAADQETYADLRQRYAFDTGKAAAIWNNAETLRISLELRGMSVNADTVANTGRLQLLFDQAASALQAHNWDDARLKLQGVETITQRIAQVVGQ
jgi:hypothetical protein